MFTRRSSKFTSGADVKPFGNICEIAATSRQELEYRTTQFAKSFYIGDHMRIAKILSRFKIYLDTRDAGIAPHLCMDGYWESWVTKFIAKVVKPGDHCVDAGANFGYYSLVLAELAGKNGKTIAIEANTYLCKLLNFTSKLNEHQFEVLHRALSDVEGEVTLQVPVDYLGSGTLRTESIYHDCTFEKVQGDTMDNIIAKAGFPKVDFIKMDCEGLESTIFKGMDRTLQQNPNLKMVMEYSPFMYKDAAAFTDMLFSKFTIGQVTSDSDVKQFTLKDSAHLLNLDDHIDLYLELKR
jgi:FkbM family methyltransferase